MKQVEAQYRRAVVLLAPLGFNAQDVRAMSHSEVRAWMQTLAEVKGGAKAEHEGGVHYTIMRKNRGE